MSYAGDCRGYYVLAQCMTCGGTHFVNGICQACALEKLKKEVEQLKKTAALKTSCDPDVGWGGD